MRSRRDKLILVLKVAAEYVYAMILMAGTMIVLVLFPKFIWGADLLSDDPAFLRFFKFYFYALPFLLAAMIIPASIKRHRRPKDMGD